MQSRTTRRQTLAVALILVAGLAGARLGAQTANVAGDWTFSVQTDQGSGTPAISFKQDGETLTGTYVGTFGSANLKGTVKGAAIEFSFIGRRAGADRSTVSTRARSRRTP